MHVMSKPWEGYFEPLKIWGNVYFVGTVPASTHIIDTGDGLIMIDSGYLESLYLVIHNMYKLGLYPKDIKYIVHLCHCTLRAIAIRAERTLGSLRYAFGGDHPSQTTHQAVSFNRS